MKIRALANKVMYGYRASSEAYINKLRESGAKIGNDIVIYYPHIVTISPVEAFFLEMENYIRIDISRVCIFMSM